MYFLAIQNGCELPNIKIGRSDNAARRFKEHSQHKNGVEVPFEVLCVVRASASDESHLKRHFRTHSLSPSQREIFYPVPEVVDYVRWLRDQHFVWVPDDEQSGPIECVSQLENVDASLWMPATGRTKRAPAQAGLFNEFGPLRLPPRETTADDFYTNPEIIEAARRVMGGIDLDPASHAKANAVVKAQGFYTKADNGLAQKWAGRVWLNPPFSKWALWAPKIVDEWASGRIESMCVLCATRTLSAQYFATLLSAASAMCITTGRFKFWGGRAGDSPDDGHVIFYFGHDKTKFRIEFLEIGVSFQEFGR